MDTQKCKGRFLVSKFNKSRRLRCSVAVFLCWAIIVCLGLAVYLIYALLYVRPTRMDIGISTSWYIRRAEWQAIDAFGIAFLNLPLSNVILGHSGNGYCNEKYDCGYRALMLQQTHIIHGLRDISPNFLIGGNGYVLEGRGANVQAAMLDGWNHRSIGVMFLGDYHENTVDDAQIDNLKEVLHRLVELNVLKHDYDLYGICQLSNSTSPGPNIFERLKEFPHWNRRNSANCEII